MPSVRCINRLLLVALFLVHTELLAQVPVDLSGFRPGQGVRVRQSKNLLSVWWPAGSKRQGRLVVGLEKGSPLLQQLALVDNGVTKMIAENLDPVFLLTVGRRDLVSQNGWNIFFDKVPLKPFQPYRVSLVKDKAALRSEGSRTILSVGNATAPGFSGRLEITLYNGSPLFNVAAVLATGADSTAIVYDAGLPGQGLALASHCMVRCRRQNADAPAVGSRYGRK